MNDPRVGYVPIGCGMCFECRTKVANNWRLRLMEDIKKYKGARFIALTFSNESYTELAKIINKKDNVDGYELDNQIATLAVRRFLERWRKKYKKSIRHWLITELGGGWTEHLHLHGIIYETNLEEVERIWKYGHVWKGKKKNGGLINYVNNKTINYMVKYVHKIDENHRLYKPKVLCTKGIGKNYKNSYDAKKRNKFKGKDTETTYKTQTGGEIAMPIYWRNQLYSEEEREQLWIAKLDEGIRFIGGEKVKADDEKAISKTLEWYRKRNKEMGYGSPDDWDAIEYERQRRNLMQKRRFENRKENDNKNSNSSSDDMDNKREQEKIIISYEELSKQKKRIVDDNIPFD